MDENEVVVLDLQLDSASAEKTMERLLLWLLTVG